MPAVRVVREALEAKSKEFWGVIKTGRTHLMDATPLTLGQEFSGYVTQLDRGMAAIGDSMERLRELALGGTAGPVLLLALVPTLHGCPLGHAYGELETLSVLGQARARARVLPPAYACMRVHFAYACMRVHFAYACMRVQSHAYAGKHVH